MKCKPAIILSVATLLTFLSNGTIAQRFPTEIEVNALLRGCGGGWNNEAESTFNKSVVLWKAEIDAVGRAKASTIISILEAVETDADKLEAYQIYASCFQEAIERYVGSSNASFGLAETQAREFELQLWNEIAKNLHIMDTKLWLIEPLGNENGYIHTTEGEVTAFKKAMAIPYATDRYELLEKYLVHLEDGYDIKKFYRWLADSSSLQSILSGNYKYSNSDSDAYMDQDRRFLRSIYTAQRKTLYLYVFGCKLISIESSCETSISKIQSDFRILKNVDEPIFDVDATKLESLLEEFSGEMRAADRSRHDD